MDIKKRDYMEKINLFEISWLRTHRNGFLYPCKCLNDNEIKFILSDELLARKNVKEENSFWDDTNWNSIFMKRFNKENSVAFFFKTEDLFYKCSYFSFNSENKIIKGATKIIKDLLDSSMDEEQIRKAFYHEFSNYLKDKYLSKDELESLINELEEIGIGYEKFLKEKFSGIDFTGDVEKKKLFLKRNNR